MGDFIIAILTREQVKVIIFIAYITYIFQVLDVVLFGALTKHSTGLRMLKKQQPSAVFILKVYHDFNQMIVEFNIWDAFAAIGFIYDIEQNPHGLLFDEEQFRQSLGFAELWGRNPPLESLSNRCQESKF
jgi:hypothetical protein